MNMIWMTVDEVALYLKVSRSQIYKLAQSNKMPCSKIGQQWRFNQLDIDNWLRANNKLNLSEETQWPPKKRAGRSRV